MKQYILLVHGDTKTEPTAEEWAGFFASAGESGLFKGGSAIGERMLVGDARAARPSTHITGYMRFDTDDKPRLLELPRSHPVVKHGGVVELCEMPKS